MTETGYPEGGILDLLTRNAMLVAEVDALRAERDRLREERDTWQANFTTLGQVLREEGQFTAANIIERMVTLTATNADTLRAALSGEGE